MKLAYLLNTYPITSTTFIRREIEAIEALGQPVARVAVRRWPGPLVDPEDIADQRRTEYLLSGNIGGLFGAAIAEAVTNLPRLLSTLPAWWRLYRAAGGGLVRHAAYLLEAACFHRRAKALGIEHVHAHFSTNAATVAMLARRLGGPSFSFTVHGPDELLDPPSNSLASKVKEAAFVVAISNYARHRIEQEAPSAGAKIRIIGCGIDLSDFQPSAETPAQAGRFVCVGRLCAAKGQMLIPAALAAVRAHFPEASVDLVGDGDERAAIAGEARRHGVEDHIRFLGWAANDAVREHIRASAVLMLPSHAEGLPIVLMEALALERPVLTTTVAGIPELVDGGCGWIIPPGSVEALAGAMHAALAASPEERAAKGAEGRRRVEARHDVRRNAAALLSQFKAATEPDSTPFPAKAR